MAAGVVGALVRFGTVEGTTGLFGTDPDRIWVGLLVVNVVGSAIVGVVVGGTGRWSLSDSAAAAITVGFCGGLTTLSTLSVEVARTMRAGGVTEAAGWVTVNVAACVVAVWWGNRVATR